jgi:DNA adenine methylase
MKKKNLLDKCNELGLENYHTKNKSQLIEIIINKEQNIITNISPLRYPGGKTRACKILDDVISQHFDLNLFNILASPFFGGGSFEFYFQNKYKYKLCVNDKFTPLYNFWNQIKLDKNKLCEELIKNNNITKDIFTNYRKTILELNNNILQQAIQYFIINRCSFSGATLSGGFSEEASKKRYTLKSIDKIRTLNLNNTEIYNFDFEYFINKYINNNCLIFLDPPYYLNKNSKLYGYNGDMHEKFDHERLFSLIKTKKNWIITYNNCEYIRTLYKDYKIIDVNWNYGMNKTKKSSEIIIISN